MASRLPRDQGDCPLCDQTDCRDRCSKCQQAYYCSQEHQRQAYKTHKLHCTHANASQPLILIFMLDGDQPMFHEQNFYGRHVDALRAAGKRVIVAATRQQALIHLVAPTCEAVWVADGSIILPSPANSRLEHEDDFGYDPLPPEEYSHHLLLLRRLDAFVRRGNRLVFGGLFTSFAALGYLPTFFAHFLLPWQMKSYHRETWTFRPQHAQNLAVQGFATSYSAKAVTMKNVPTSDIVYGKGSEASIIWTRKGEGYIGFIGDVNSETESDRPLLAMLGI